MANPPRAAQSTTAVGSQESGGRSKADIKHKISQLRLAAEQARLLGTVVENAGDGVLILTPAVEEGGPRIAYVNAAFSRITGYPRDQVIANTLDVLGFAKSDAPLHPVLLQHMFDEKPFSGEAESLRIDGSLCHLEVSAIPVRDEVGQLSHWIMFVRDVSERKTAMIALERQAQYDGLTDLPNRVLLLDRLEQAILSQRRRKTSVALMIMDLDRFKEVNDCFGHHAGDILLRQVAYRLRSVSRKSDTIARLGGDEFAVILPQVASRETAEEVARKLLRVFETPFLLPDQSIKIGASIGIAICPDHGHDAASLLRCADIAMYQSKKSRTEPQVYSPHFDRSTAEQLGLESDFHIAVDQNQLVLHYQPIIDFRSGRPIRAEALVRWNHPETGLIPPDRFLPIAESTGLLRRMNEWVINEALRQCAKWRDTGVSMKVAVNLSPSSLRDASVSEVVSDLLSRWSIEPSDLALEITENSIMTDPGSALAVLSLLQTLGVSLSLDDFGTGYSSLANLRQVPFDEIKIDKSFVMEMTANGSDAAIVRSTIDLAHNLGKVVVAEGVENAETWMALADLGCDFVQGYYISKPMPGEGLPEWLDQHRLSQSSPINPTYPRADNRLFF